MSQTVLITGASSGIGRELGKVFAAQGYSLVLVARRADKLHLLQEELKHEYKIDVTVLVQDLRQADAPEQIFVELRNESIEIDVLVNNAGFGSFGAFADSDLHNQLQMIQVNISALTHLTKLALVGMKARGRGKILNVASTAGFQPGPLMAVYYASKAYVLSFSEALANEERGHGITVTALCPGPTRTEFEQAANLQESKLFQSGVMDARNVAKIGYAGLMGNKSVVIPGMRNKVLASSIRFIPRNVVTAVVRNMQGKR